MSNIISIQSHVAYGYVGNKAVTFPLQLLGNEVIVINTVQFSNRTAYGRFKGQVFSSDHISDVMDGLYEGNFLDSCNAMLSGFIGDYTIGEIIVQNAIKLKNQQSSTKNQNNKKRNNNNINNDFIYCCDPVMGDEGRGFFVKPGIFEFMRDVAIPSADIITPNQFEAAHLSGVNITNLSSVKLSANTLYNMGPKCVVITSVLIDEIPKGMIGVLVYNGKDYYLIKTPYIDFGTIQLNGCGDLFAALFLHYILKNNNITLSIEKTIYSLYNILYMTKISGTKELEIISNQMYISNPEISFKAEKV